MLAAFMSSSVEFSMQEARRGKGLTVYAREGRQARPERVQAEHDAGI